ALGEQSRWNLECGHPPAVRGTDDPDLREGQPELVRPDRQQHVEDVRESVVDEVDAAGGGEHRAGARFHPSIIPERPAAFKLNTADRQGREAPCPSASRASTLAPATRARPPWSAASGSRRTRRASWPTARSTSSTPSSAWCACSTPSGSTRASATAGSTKCCERCRTSSSTWEASWPRHPTPSTKEC